MLLPSASTFVTLVLISWPVLLYFYWIGNCSKNGMRILLYAKIRYIVLLVVLLVTVILIWIIMVIVIRLLVYVVFGIYVNYWIIIVGMLILMVGVYCYIGNLMVLLGLLPMLYIFIKQHLLTLLIILKVLFYPY